MSDFEVVPVGTAARLAELEQEVERLRERIREDVKLNQSLMAEVERLRADAERYRWLRDGGADKSNIGVYEWIETYGQQRRVWLARQELDDSIDAWRRRLECKGC